MPPWEIVAEIGFIVVVWIAPLFVAVVLGDKKGRRGWLYGLVLGWIGVLFLVALRPVLGSPADTKMKVSSAQVDGLRVAAERFARGEIDHDEYDRLRDKLTS